MPPDNYGSGRRQKGSTANAKIHHAEASARRAQPEIEGKREGRAKGARERLASYCLAAGGFASGAGAGAAGSAMGEVPRISGGAKQSPAQSLVPLTVPTSLQAIGAIGFACFSGLPPILGAAV